MKQFLKRMVVIIAALALVVGVLPANNAEAAKKKTKTITVTTQEELEAALKKYKSSGSKVKIIIETNESSTFTLSAKYSSDNLQIVVDAPNATIKSKAKVSSITINEAKTVKEYASGNKITVNDEKLTFKAMENSSVEKLTIASETGTVKVVNNGGIEKVAVKSEVKVELTQNGEVGRLYVGAAADISVRGTSEESLKVTVRKDAVGASVKSEVPVSVNAYADVELKLDKGAENSKVTIKEETAGVKLENNTEETVAVKDTEGKTQKVETGEEIVSENYVGKEETSSTEEKKDDTATDKKDDKKEEKKDEKKVDETASTGSTSSGESYVPYVSPEQQLRNDLSAAKEFDKVRLTFNVTLSSDLTIPENVTLELGAYTLDARGKKIIFNTNAEIKVANGGKLLLDKDGYDTVLDDVDDNETFIMLSDGSELTIGDFSFKSTAGSEVRDCVQVSIHTRIEGNALYNEDTSSYDPIFTRDVWINLEGQELLIDGPDPAKLPEAFGGYVCDYNLDVWDLPELEKDKTYTSVRLSYTPNILVDKQTIMFKGVEEPMLLNTIDDTDWLQVYLNRGLHDQIGLAENAGKTAPEGISYSATEDNITVTVSRDVFHITKTVNVNIKNTLVGETFVLDERAFCGSPKYLEAEMCEHPSIKVRGKLEVKDIKSSVESEHTVAILRGIQSTVKLGDKIFFAQPNEDSTPSLQYNSGSNLVNFVSGKSGDTVKLSKVNNGSEFDLMMSVGGAEAFEVIPSPVNGELLRPGSTLTVNNGQELMAVGESTKYVSRSYKILKREPEFKNVVLNGTEADAGYNGKKPVKVYSYSALEDGEEVFVNTELNGVDVTLGEDTVLVLGEDSELALSCGASLTVTGLCADKNAVRGGELLIEATGETRVTLEKDARITIGDYTFKALLDDPVKIKITKEEDSETHEMFISFVISMYRDVPDADFYDSIITNKNGSVDYTALNTAFGAEGTVRFEITNYRKELAESLVELARNLAELEPDINHDELEADMELILNVVFPAIDIDEHASVFTDDKGKFVIGRYSVADNGYEFTTDSIWGLKAIQRRIDREYEDENGDPVSAKVHFNLGGTNGIDFEHITLVLPAVVIFEGDGKEINLGDYANITMGVEVASGSSINLKGKKSVLRGYDGCDVSIKGTLNVGKDSYILAGDSMKLVIASGASFVLDGELLCEVLCDKGDDSQPEFDIALKNNGTVTTTDPSNPGKAVIEVSSRDDDLLVSEEISNSGIASFKGLIGNNVIAVELLDFEKISEMGTYLTYSSRRIE